MTFDRNRPYNSLPPLPPDADIETKAILKRCISTGRALGELKQAGGLIPNQSVLINTIPLIEAQTSSEIENIVTTSDRLFQLAAGSRLVTDPATKETLRYRTALYEGYQALKAQPLSTNTAVRVCRTLRGAEVDIRSTPGTAIASQTSAEVVYTPPEGQALIREKLADWERFLYEDNGIDPLVRMAVMHYQFEAIHPFSDGNGRTGRILCLLYLIQAGLLEIPVLYLSRYLIRHKNRYYNLLQQVTEEGTWEHWILFMLQGLEETALWTLAKIGAIRELLEHSCGYVRRKVPKKYSRELVELTFRQPYCRITNLVEAGIVKRQSASEYLKALAAIGVLKEIKAGREKLFVHPRLLRLLTAEDNEFTPYGR